MDDDKDVVNGVCDIARRHAETAESSPHVGKVAGIDDVERVATLGLAHVDVLPAGDRFRHGIRRKTPAPSQTWREAVVHTGMSSTRNRVVASSCSKSQNTRVPIRLDTR